MATDQELVEQLDQVWGSITDLGATLDESKWKTPTEVPGWSVQDGSLRPLWGRDHRRWSLMDGVDDLGVVDPAQIHRGDPEIGIPELALDD